MSARLRLAWITPSYQLDDDDFWSPALTALALYNTVSTRLGMQTAVGRQLADLSRGVGDLARQVAEIGRRLAAAESRVEAAVERARAVTDP